MLTETSRAVVLAGEHAETTQPAPATFDRHASPIRLLADAPDDWRALLQHRDRARRHLIPDAIANVRVIR